MKKVLSFILLSLFVLALTGCAMIDNAVNGGDGDANDSLEITQEESQAKLEKMEEDGYLITYNYTDDEGNSGTFTLGAKGNVVWFISDGEGAAILEEGDSLHCYDYSAEDGYTYTNTVHKEQEESVVSTYKLAYSGWLYWANTYNGQFKKGSDATVAGRSCYTYDLDLLGSLGGLIGSLAGLTNVKYKVYVDKELGVTLKVEFTATAEGETSSFSYEVTQFLTGSKVVAPTLPEHNKDGVSTSFTKARVEFYEVTGILVPELTGLEVEEYPYTEGDTSYCFDIIGGAELGYNTYEVLKAFLDTELADWTCSGPSQDGEYINVNYTSDSAWVGLTWDSVNLAVYLNASVGIEN